MGGKVETKVPRAGYVLVQPGTPEEQRLRMCWASPDRPERFFVPYTFVDACKLQNMLIKQIFLLNGKPMGIHIHQSIANMNVRAALTQRILVGFSICRTLATNHVCISIPAETHPLVSKQRVSF